MPEHTDPLEALRLPAMPIAPRSSFAGELRRRVQAALQEESAMTDTASTSTDAEAATPAYARSSLTPYLGVRGAAEAIDWYRDLFGAVETTRFVGDDGRVGHAELTIGEVRIMLADEYPEIGANSPATLGGTTVTLHMEVVDVDYSYQRAVDAGANADRSPADQGHGNRNATITDPFGHR